METLKVLKEKILADAKAEARRLKENNRQTLNVWKEEVEAETQEAYQWATEKLKKEQQKSKQEFQARLKMQYRNEILSEKQRHIQEVKNKFLEALAQLEPSKKLEYYKKFWQALLKKYSELRVAKTLEISLAPQDEGLLPELEKIFDCKLTLKQLEKTITGGFLLFNQDLHYDASFESVLKEQSSALTILINQKLFLEGKGDVK